MRQSPRDLREPPPASVRASRAAALALRCGWKGWAIAAVTALFLALAGAFGTGAAPFALRLGYWLATLLTGATAALFVATAVQRGGWFDDRPLVQGLVIAVALSVPLTGAVWAITRAFFGDRAPMDHGVLGYFPAVFVITCAVTALNYLVERQPSQTHAEVGHPPARFLDRLPPKLRGGELHAIEAHDHYLRLHTDRGSDLILMRLSDAIAELDGIEGAQTHRSWWVARAAVDKARRGDGRATLRLRGGLEAPVSRTYARALREAGWF